VIALLRYQAAILLRSHRWVFPLISYALLISVAGIGQKQATSEVLQQQALSQGLVWSAAMLLPVQALLTRSMLTAEPSAARGCVAAATGPVRAQLAVLLTALAGGAVLGLAGAGYELATSGNLFRLTGAVLAATLASGLGKALICAFVGSAVGTICNPPVIRHQALALLSTVGAVILALLASFSPVSAALRTSGSTAAPQDWPTGMPFLAAFALLVVAWAVSALLAARRGA